MENKLTDLQIAQAFADENRHALAWGKRELHRGFCYWFVDGRLDEYGIAARKLVREYLINARALVVGA